jgi:hypothetical protein
MALGEQSFLIPVDIIKITEIVDESFLEFDNGRTDIRNKGLPKMFGRKIVKIRGRQTPYKNE